VTDTTIEYVRQGRPPGSRNKRTAKLFNRLEARGDLDPADFLSSIITNPEEPKELRIQAAGLFMPYKYGKHGSIPPARFLEEEIEVPEFTSVDVAEKFLAHITVLLGCNKLELDFASAFRELTVGWIQSQYAKQGIDLKAQAQGCGQDGAEPITTLTVGKEVSAIAEAGVVVFAAVISMP
jgi:hypothetical protein